MGQIVSIKIDPVVGDTAALPAVDLAASKVFSAAVEILDGISNATFSSIKVYYVKGTATAVNLKTTLRHIDTTTLPVTVHSHAEADYVTFTPAGTAGQIDSFSVAATLFTNFTTISSADTIAIDLERKSTDTGTVSILRIDFELDQAAAATNYDIDSLSNVKVYMSIASGDTTKDSFLQTLISNVSLSIEQYTGRKIKVQTITAEIGDGDGSYQYHPLYTPVYGPATSGHWETDVLTRDDLDDTFAAVEDDADHIFIREDEPFYVELYEETFPAGSKTVQVSYQAGYNPIPGDLLITFYEMVQQSYKESMSGGGLLGMQTENFATANVSKSFRDLRPQWKAVLDRYRKYS